MDELRRKDDTLTKWVLGITSAIAVVIFSQFIYIMQSNAGMIERVSINTNDIQDLKDFKLKLIRIEVMTEMVVNKQNEMGAQIKEVTEKQNQILSKGRK